MTWTYRIVERDGTHGIHEVFFDEEGRPQFRTEEPVGILSEDGIEGLRKELERMSKALEHPVLTDADFVGEIERS